ncbi:TonB-dependent receptor [Euryhalocaulis caribicus]|uniref:TonB-dependent receptor n=1 Tax=Euryhalocaulis caribicus TaxID=1161401 RepID=UPI00039EBB5E|nr:TonB-dependent receptor [Euryhalocaulis caribicus]
MNKSTLAALLASASAGVLAMTGAAQAQTEGQAVSEPVPQAAPARSQDEIVVTARRREESLQDVPVAVTAYSGDQLAQVGAQDITYVAQTTPNVTLEVSRGTNSTLSAFIRGVGQQDPVAGFEAGVGVYVDDVYLNRPQAAVLDIYDVERIEVLRGPQGTLYGRNTIGGAIKYVTKRLGDQPAFEATAKYGSYDQKDLIVSGSVPLADTFRVGGAVARLTRDGFGENIVTGEENYNKDLWGARASAEFEPNADMFFRISGDYIKDESNARQGHRLIPANISDAPVLDDKFDTRAGLDVVDQEVEAYGGSFLAEINLSDSWQVRNILAYREDESTSPIDFDSLQSADVDVPAIYKNDQFSEELQLLYSGDRLNGLIGFYYLDANASTVFDVLLDVTGQAVGSPGLNAQTFGDVSTETWSVFGDFTYDFTDQWSLSLGGRYTSDERTSQVLRRTYIGGFSEFFGGNPILIATTSDFNGSAEYEDFSPRASLQWQPNADHNLYASYSQGFKGGSFDPRGQTTAAPDFNGDGVVSDDEVFQFMNFEPEEVDSYELGWKFSNGRYSHSLAVFYADYKDIQVPGSVGVDTDGDGVSDTFTGVTTNAGAATLKGVEYEGRLAVAEDMFTPADGLNFSWSLGYLDGEYDRFINAFGTDISDQVEIQNTPDWTASGTAAYFAPLRGGELTASTTLSYRGDSTQFEVPFPLLDQESYTLWNASITWQGDHWGFGVHGRNLTDERYKVAGYDFVNNDTLAPELGLEGTLTAYYGDPRTVTATVSYRY